MLPTSFAIVVTGVPASGKSTIGAAVASRLGVPLFDKDEILEGSFSTNAVDADERRRLSRIADRSLMDLIASEPRVVVVSHWRRPELSVESGTPTEWLSNRPNVLEIYCDCPPDIAATRFSSRTRHPGHGDQAKNANEIREQLHAQARLGPLNVGRLVRVETSAAVDADELTDRLLVTLTTL